MSVVFTETIIPWILGTLLLLIVFTFVVAVKSWREMKRSPYFFMRQQAEKRLQTYMSTSLVLLFLTVGIAAYAWQAPADNISRVAVLVNTKPPTKDVVDLVQDSPETADSIELVESLAKEQATEIVPSSKPTLPKDFDQFEPTAELRDDTQLGSLFFSTEVTERYEPVEPNNIFAEGFYTIYATFEYEAMADGMEWAWVWRHNGEVLEGGNELWEYGEDGPGYIYLNPEEGFENGEYTLDVWVNGELLTRSDLTVNTAAAAAGN
ncbi:MAG: hypothetical protein IAF02_16545 [Anaerolineae bacterium]|nr:hypothetical protein [Anaerolineae bacterium]